MKAYGYITMAALALSFAACSQDDDFALQSDPNAVKINATIGTMPQTRVAYDIDGNTTFSSGDQIIVTNATRSGMSKSEAIYTYSNPGWSASNSGEYVVWTGGTENTFHGATPATTGTSYTEFTIPTDQSGSAEDNKIYAADWMTANYTGAKPADGTINLYFEHRLAKVTVKVEKWNSEFDGVNPTISDAKIYSKSKTVGVTYGTGENGADVYSGDGTLTGITPKVSGETFTAIVAPIKYQSSDEFMTFTIGKQDLTVLATASQLTGGLDPGKHYTFNLTVGKERVSIDKVTIKDWTTQDVDGGIAEEDK